MQEMENRAPSGSEVRPAITKLVGLWFGQLDLLVSEADESPSKPIEPPIDSHSLLIAERSGRETISHQVHAFLESDLLLRKHSAFRRVQNVLLQHYFHSLRSAGTKACCR